MLKKIIVLAVMFTALSFSVYVKASDVTPTELPSPTPTPEIDAFTKLELVRGSSYNINTMLYYYHNVLTSDQQEIVRFLIGTYNYMYISARGFSYEDVTDLDDFIDKFDEFAEFIVGVDSNFVESNTSRWSTNFQIYIASIITYAGNINVSFDTWIESIAPSLIIPFSNDALDAWTEFYNDPSNSGIINFGSETRDWNLGIQYPYAYGDYNFANSGQQSIYTNFLLNYSPVMYTNNWSNSPNGQQQYIISFKDIPLVDTIYVQRGINGFSNYRFGFYNGTFTNYHFNGISFYVSSNKVWSAAASDQFTYNFSIVNTGDIGNIDYIINHALNKGPVTFPNNINRFYSNWYIGITHIVLVDDLNTLENRQDVYNDYTLGLITDYDWIKKPKNDLPYWWKPLDFDVIIEQPNGDVDNSSDDDFTQNIVNNTVINNYDIVAPGVTINVPVDWFDGDYLEYTYNTGLPFFVFVGDVFSSLGELRIIILGVLIFGLVSGIIVKFLQ